MTLREQLETGQVRPALLADPERRGQLRILRYVCMLQYATIAGGRIYAYYKCSRLVRNGKDDCWPDRFRANHRAEEVERRVWEFVSGLLKDLDELQADLHEVDG